MKYLLLPERNLIGMLVLYMLVKEKLLQAVHGELKIKLLRTDRHYVSCVSYVQCIHV